MPLEVTPAVGLADEPIRVRARGLAPGAKVRLTSSLTDEKNIEFWAESWYVADEQGAVDTAVHPSIGGSFEVLALRVMLYPLALVSENVGHG